MCSQCICTYYFWLTSYIVEVYIYVVFLLIVHPLTSYFQILDPPLRIIGLHVEYSSFKPSKDSTDKDTQPKLEIKILS